MLRDASLVVRASAAFAASCGSFLELNGTGYKGLALQVNVGAGSGSVPTLSVFVHGSTSTTCTSASSLIAAAPTIDANGGEFLVPFHMDRARSFYFKFDIGGTSPSFADLQAYVTQNRGTVPEYDRSISFR